MILVVLDDVVKGEMVEQRMHGADDGRVHRYILRRGREIHRLIGKCHEGGGLDWPLELPRVRLDDDEQLCRRVLRHVVAEMIPPLFGCFPAVQSAAVANPLPPHNDFCALERLSMSAGDSAVDRVTARWGVVAMVDLRRRMAARERGARWARALVGSSYCRGTREDGLSAAVLHGSRGNSNVHDASIKITPIGKARRAPSNYRGKTRRQKQSARLEACRCQSSRAR